MNWALMSSALLLTTAVINFTPQLAQVFGASVPPNWRRVITGADMQGGQRALAYLCPLDCYKIKPAQPYTLKAFSKAQIRQHTKPKAS
jgi:hypothetical protein